jgi:transcriptional regulator with XRE-family HTH domain
MGALNALVEKTIYSHAYAAFCRVLRQTRERQGLTQTVLAARLRRPQSFVAKVESGQRRLDVVELLAVAKGLRVSPERIIDSLIAEIGHSRPAVRRRK